MVGSVRGVEEKAVLLGVARMFDIKRAGQTGTWGNGIGSEAVSWATNKGSQDENFIKITIQKSEMVQRLATDGMLALSLQRAETALRRLESTESVSYTPLTLPTIHSV